MFLHDRGWGHKQDLDGETQDLSNMWYSAQKTKQMTQPTCLPIKPLREWQQQSADGKTTLAWHGDKDPKWTPYDYRNWCYKTQKIDKQEQENTTAMTDTRTNLTGRLLKKETKLE